MCCSGLQCARGVIAQHAGMRMPRARLDGLELRILGIQLALRWCGGHGSARGAVHQARACGARCASRRAAGMRLPCTAPPAHQQPPTAIRLTCRAARACARGKAHAQFLHRGEAWRCVHSALQQHPTTQRHSPCSQQQRSLRRLFLLRPSSRLLPTLRLPPAAAAAQQPAAGAAWLQFKAAKEKAMAASAARLHVATWAFVRRVRTDPAGAGSMVTLSRSAAVAAHGALALGAVAKARALWAARGCLPPRPRLACHIGSATATVSLASKLITAQQHAARGCTSGGPTQTWPPAPRCPLRRPCAWA